MPSIQDISQMVNELHNKKLVNIEATAREMLSLQSSVLNGKDPGLVGWYVLGGDHYVVVCGQDRLLQSINPAVNAAVNPAGIQNKGGF